MKGDFPKYPEYNALNEYKRRCLVANNYWAVINGDKPISVPPEDTYYYKYFDRRCFDIRKKKVAELMGQPDQPAVQERKLAPRDPANCTAHAPMPDGQGGFKCERCGTVLKTRITNPEPAGRPEPAKKPVKRTDPPPATKFEKFKKPEIPEPKQQPKQNTLF